MSRPWDVISLAAVENGALVEERDGHVAAPWWSFTKTVLAAAALALVRDARLALDEPPPGRAYTLRQLLQHRAGVADYGGLPAYHEAVARGDEPWPVPLLLERAEGERLRYQPGRGWGYSNIGYLFVRQMIEEAAGESIGAALDRLVHRPLGIGGARLARTPDDLDGVAMGRVGSYHPGWIYHGLLVGPVRDAALLLHRLMTGLLLPPDLLARMRDACPLGGPVPGRPWAAPGYGLGLMSGMTTCGEKAEGHTGGGPGSVIAVYHLPHVSPARTVATFAFGEDPARVEEAAFRRGRS